MSLPRELPRKCGECVKSSKPFIHAKCNFCKDLEFQEEVLCDLNRCVQDPVTFTCHAFQPILKLVVPFTQEVPPSPKDPTNSCSERFFGKLLSSDKIGYERALALQKLGRDPDAVVFELKYHLAWNAIHRKPVFVRSENMFNFINDIFSKFSDLVGGFVRLLWLAPDHLHLYMESDGEKSIEVIAQKMKRQSASAILEEFADLKASLDAENELWDKAYFVETVG